MDNVTINITTTPPDDVTFNVTEFSIPWTLAQIEAAKLAIINGAPGNLDDLNKLAASIGDDPAFAATVAAALALKAPLASPIFTGVPEVPTAAPGTNTTQAASTAFVLANGGVGTIKGSVAATAGLIPFGTGVANEVGTNSLFKFDGTRLGIGTATPNSIVKLDVEGNIRVGGTLFVDRIAGAVTAYFQFITRGASVISNFSNCIGNGAAELSTNGTAGFIIGTYDAKPFVWGTNNTERARLLSTGEFGLGVTVPTAILHIKAETTAASTEPIRLTAPSAQTTVPVAGAFGIAVGGDNLNFVIATGAARKSIVLADGTLTAGRVSYNGTNGRQTDSAGMTYSGTLFGLIATTEQLRVGHDASNYYSTTVSSAGLVTLNAVGSGAGFVFSDSVKITPLAGTNDRLVQADSTGLTTAVTEIIEQEITNGTTITDLTTGGNWTGTAYTGTAITGTYKGQNYAQDATYYYVATADNVWRRLTWT